MSFPESWVTISVGDIASVNGGLTKNASKRNASSDIAPLVSVAAVHFRRIDEEKIGRVGLLPSDAERALLRKGDLLVVEGNGSLDQIGRVALWTLDVPGARHQNHIICVRPCMALPGFLLEWLASPAGREAIVEQATSATGLYSLSLSKVERLRAPLPPLNEQRRIVDKIEALTARSRRAKEALDAVPALLDKLRQSILAAAFRGDLTADWRAAHPDVEPASALLERIRQERRQRWEAAEFAKMNAAGKPPKNDNWKAKYQAPEPVDTDGLPELPEGWAWARLGDLGQDPLAPVQTGPFGAQLHNSEFVSDGVPVIAVGNLTGFGFSRKGLYHVTAKKAEQLGRYDVQHGDILFARSGATLGKVCVAPDYVQDWRMTGHILRARLNASYILPALVVYALRGAPAVVRQVQSGVRGMTRPGYNTALLEQIAIPIPPGEEQAALLDVVQAALTQLNSLEEQRDAVERQQTTLNAAILAKAFRGQLVPQDPNDEPASVLLDRIRAEREAAAPAQKAKKKRASKKKARKTA